MHPFYPLLVPAGRSPPVQLECKMDAHWWIQQVTTRVAAVTCWIQQPVSPKQGVRFTCVFNSEVDEIKRKFIVQFFCRFGSSNNNSRKNDALPPPTFMNATLHPHEKLKRQLKNKTSWSRSKKLFFSYSCGNNLLLQAMKLKNQENSKKKTKT